MRDARCEMRDARCEMRDARCEMRDARCEMRDARCEMRDARCEMLNFIYLHKVKDLDLLIMFKFVSNNANLYILFHITNYYFLFFLIF
jgi:hypothetical protein